MRHALSIDLEEFFQIHALCDVVHPHMWEGFPSCVEQNTEKILGLLEKRSIKATFFCLGWIAERHPNLIKHIYSSGHEIACHGYSHQVIYNQDQSTFREDVETAKKILEDITGSEVIGYRAPTYSITMKTLWALEILEDLGFHYDSSIFPIYHDNYGIPDSPRLPHKLPGTQMVEFPISTLRFGKCNFPVSGGGYFRLFPYPITRMALGSLNKRKEPFVFYIHPWEFNPETLRVKNMRVLSRFRTFIGISRTYEKFSRLISDFEFAPVKQVLEDNNLL
jgi:polysaccharide deacetylase family protein (PEP-CTERM system associated)